MKANNITISINSRCSMKCPYCISNMTFKIVPNNNWFEINLKRAVNVAKRANISHCLITSKGEPTNNPKMLSKVMHAFKNFPIEVQTHYGSKYLSNDIIDIFYSHILNVLAISIDHPAQIEKGFIWDKLSCLPWTIRLAVVLTNNFKGWRLMDFIEFCKQQKIEQLTIRNPTIPTNYQRTELSLNTVNWINQNINNEQYIAITKELALLIESGKAHFIRDLHFGAKVYDIDGIGFVHMDYCVEEQNGEIMRSLIYQSDGHMYTSWDYPGSILW